MVSTALDRLGDEALLAAVSLGEPDAVVAFVRRFQSRVYGLAYAILRDAALAEDIAQGAFERAWRHGASYDARRGSVSTWLLTVTRNLAIDTLRIRRPEPLDPAALAELLPVGGGPGPEAAAVAGDDLDRLRDELRSLPVEQRRAVLMATIMGLTTTEISAIEGVPVPTAKTRLRTGLLKLRAAVVDEAGR